MNLSLKRKLINLSLLNQTYMKKVLFILSAIIFISCASTKITTPTDADVQRGKATYPDLTMEAVNTGKMHFEQQCANCHKLKNPASKTTEQWKKTVPRMAAKAEKKAGKMVIDQPTQESILRYLAAMAKH